MTSPRGRADVLHYDLHLPDEVRMFTVPAPGVRRWDAEAVVYDVRLGDAVLRHYAFTDRWFAVNCTLDLEGGFVVESGPVDWCFNCDIATPLVRSGGNLYGIDLFLDVLVAPDGYRHAVKDEDEFGRAEAAGLLTPAEAVGARIGLDDLLGIVRGPGLTSFLSVVYPFGDVGDAPSSPPMRRLPLR
jgi:hypothetical protein